MKLLAHPAMGATEHLPVIRKDVMEKFFRPILILVELALLMGIIYSLFAGVKFALVDFGLDKKYHPFIKWVLMIMGCLALVFFAAHLITFYPGMDR